jgi:hypothetical protein
LNNNNKKNKKNKQEKSKEKGDKDGVNNIGMSDKEGSESEIESNSSF